MIDEATTTRPAPPLIGARGGSAAEYRELPEISMKFAIGEPKIRQMYSDKYSKWSTMVDFPLTMTDEWKERVMELLGPLPEGVYQSWRPAFGGYSCGYTLNSSNAGKESALTTFMACAFGSKNAGEVRKWIKAGGCPTVNAPTNEGRIAQIESWLSHLTGAYIWGTIKHDIGRDGQILARFGGPVAVGSMPNEPAADVAAYNATMKGHLRAMQADEPPPPAPTTVEEAVAQGAAVAQAAKRQEERLLGGAIANAARLDKPTDELEAVLAAKQAEPAVNSVKGCAQHGAPQADCNDCYASIFGTQPATA